jgi:hypothetical protein
VVRGAAGGPPGFARGEPIAFPLQSLGIKGVVVGQGDTYEAAVADLKSALQFHKETFGQDSLEVDPPILEAFIAETGVPS